MATRRAPPDSGTGLNSTALTNVNTIVFRPIPRASVRTTAAENQPCARIVRIAREKSRIMKPHYENGSSEVPVNRVDSTWKIWAPPCLELFGAKRLHGIDAAGSPCRYCACSGSNCEQRDGDSGIDERVDRRGLVEHSAQDARGG